jgi:hypothetical protein
MVLLYALCPITLQYNNKVQKQLPCSLCYHLSRQTKELAIDEFLTRYVKAAQVRNSEEFIKRRKYAYECEFGRRVHT